MGWGWIPALLTGLMSILKGIFGMDKPEEMEINDEPTPDSLRVSDDDVMSDLGVRTKSGTAGEDGIRDSEGGKPDPDP